MQPALLRRSNSFMEKKNSHKRQIGDIVGCCPAVGHPGCGSLYRPGLNIMTCTVCMASGFSVRLTGFSVRLTLINKELFFIKENKNEVVSQFY